MKFKCNVKQRFARASYCDIGKIFYTIKMIYFSQSKKALQPDLNYLRNNESLFKYYDVIILVEV